ncbi:hypothetical protein [Lapidilactobacillus bayanensis]|nr:hypothetical protein [Lapidilactobacillus bayanensis]
MLQSESVEQVEGGWQIPMRKKLMPMNGIETLVERRRTFVSIGSTTTDD